MKNLDRKDVYGKQTMKNLAADLQGVYKENFDVSNLYKFKQFYEMYSDILDTASLKSFEKLTWSHYRVLLQVKDDKARTWYEKEAAEQTWSVKTLQRNISSQYYYRMLSSQNPSVVEAEMKELTADYQNDKLEFIKNPIIAEFLGMTQNTDFTESKLEKYIITNLQSFIMELGKGYAFVARQQHIRTEKEDYYIQTEFSDDEFSKFINTIKQRSKKDFNVNVSNEDTILTLSTCANNNKYRVVLHSVRIK